MAVAHMLSETRSMMSKRVWQNICMLTDASGLSVAMEKLSRSAFTLGLHTHLQDKIVHFNNSRSVEDITAMQAGS